MRPCFPGPVPWPHCQHSSNALKCVHFKHRCAFWWRPADLCARPRQQSLSLEQGPAGKCTPLGECVLGRAWGPLCPAALWLLAREMPDGIYCWLDRLVHLCVEIRLGEIINQRQPTLHPNPVAPHLAQRALSEGVGRIHTGWKIFLTFSSCSPHCQSACVRGVETHLNMNL